MIEFIYALHAGDKDYFYCGRSDRPSERLKDHIRTACEDGTKKERHIAALLDDGYDIEMEIMESGLARHMVGKEDLWVTNLEGAGYTLLNSKGGDTAYYPIDTIEIQEATPWTVGLFIDAKWKKGDAKAKKNEWSCWIKGVQFFRQGNSKLRFWHANYGVIDVFAPDITEKYKKACLMLTGGTEENKKMIEQHHQGQRMSY